MRARQPLSPGPISLADVDECELGTHNCQAGAVCHNTKGSFYCQARQRCLEGFLQDPEGNCVGERGLPGCVCRPRGVGGGLWGGGWGGWALRALEIGEAWVAALPSPSLYVPCECQCLGPGSLCRQKLPLP